MTTMGRVVGLARQPKDNLSLATLYPRKATVPFNNNIINSYRHYSDIIVTHNHNDGARNRFKRQGFLHTFGSSFRPSPVVYTHGPDNGEGFGHIAYNILNILSPGTSFTSLTSGSLYSPFDPIKESYPFLGRGRDYNRNIYI